MDLETDVSHHVSDRFDAMLVLGLNLGSLKGQSAHLTVEPSPSPKIKSSKPAGATLMTLSKTRIELKGKKRKIGQMPFKIIL